MKNTPPRPKVRTMTGNVIALEIDRQVVARLNPELRDSYRTEICELLNIKNQYTMFLNNTQQPTLEQLVVIAQVLDVKMEELLSLTV